MDTSFESVEENDTQKKSLIWLKFEIHHLTQALNEYVCERDKVKRKREKDRERERDKVSGFI